MNATLTSVLGIVPLGSGVLTIGRSPNNGLFVNNVTVSRHHAEIRLDGQSYSVVDLESTGGTFINERRIRSHIPYPLCSGDIVRVGELTFMYEEQKPLLKKDTLDSGDDAKEPDISTPPLPSSPTPPEGDPSTILSVAAGPAYPLSPAENTPEADSPALERPIDFSQEQLRFTAFHPGHVPVETWNTLLFYAYIDTALEAVHADADQYINQLGPEPFKPDIQASHPLARGTQITAVPAFHGVTFNPARVTFTWTKDWHPAIFNFSADKRWAGAMGSGEIIIFAGPLIIASLRVSLRFDEQGARLAQDREEVSVSRYRRIFASYSHDDTPMSLAIRQAYDAIGDDSFLDIEGLRSGQNWNSALSSAIDTSDVFQLFWSNQSAQSSYVYQECQYALQHYKYNGFIRPVYWEKPMRFPPPELSHLHFTYFDLPVTTTVGGR